MKCRTSNVKTSSYIDVNIYNIYWSLLFLSQATRFRGDQVGWSTELMFIYIYAD